jgi:hypothetical protein
VPIEAHLLFAGEAMSWNVIVKAALQPVLIGVALAVVAGCQLATPRAVGRSAERQQMAAVHERVARCLRSDQPLDTCQQEMRKGCESMKGSGCGMMDTMGNKDAKGTDTDKQAQHQH